MGLSLVPVERIELPTFGLQNIQPSGEHDGRKQPVAAGYVEAKPEISE
jgi:hypothetical protein